jgi:hypothetical protein
MTSGPPDSAGEGRFEDESRPQIQALGHGLRVLEDGQQVYILMPLEFALAQREFRTMPQETDGPEPVAKCSICRDMLPYSRRPDEKWQSWENKSIDEIESSAAGGCVFCQALVRGIKACVPAEELHDDDLVAARLSKCLALGSRGDPPNKYGICIFRRDEETFWEQRGIPAGTIPCGDTKSSAAMETADQWLQLCLSQHQDCGKGEDKPSPTRLIDVQGDSSSDVRLVELNSSPCRWACLSHCWGGSRSIQTTKDTLDQTRNGISYSSLGKTFRDAVEVVRRLGLRYIWIDSLCIVQDDPADWEAEAAKMADIYESAYITIAATRSADHDAGLFSRMKPQFTAHAITLQPEGEAESTLYFRQIMPHLVDMIHSPEQAAEFPLLSRGWVFQERLLSRRILHFNNEELAWECLEISKCECGHPDNHMTFFLRPPYRHIHVGNSVNSKTEHRVLFSIRSMYALNQRWHELVDQYSGLKLTYESDILPALSGLATQMARYRPADDHYVAGMWLHSILLDLLWVAEDDQASRPEEWRGPTWSWVSTMSAVNYVQMSMFAIIGVCAKLLAMELKYATDNDYGSLAPGCRLRLRGTMFMGVLRYATAVQDEASSSTSLPRVGPAPANFQIHLDGAAVGAFNADYDLKNGGGYDFPLKDKFKLGLLLMAKTENNYHYLAIAPVVPQDEDPDDAEGGRHAVNWERVGHFSYPHFRDTRPAPHIGRPIAEREFDLV